MTREVRFAEQAIDDLRAVMAAVLHRAEGKAPSWCERQAQLQVAAGQRQYLTLRRAGLR